MIKSYKNTINVKYSQYFVNILYDLLDLLTFTNIFTTFYYYFVSLTRGCSTLAHHNFYK